MIGINAITAVTLATVSVTGNFPGAAVVGLEEDSPAVAAALESHAAGVCMDAIGSTVTDHTRGFIDFPAVFLLDGDCTPLPGNEWLEVY